MNLARRGCLSLAAGAAALHLLPRAARGQTYPTQPVYLTVGFPAGGPSDILARLVGKWLSERLGQQFIVENRPGGGGNVAAEAVVRSPPDGYRLLMISTPNAINATLYGNLSFDFTRDIAPVAGIMRVPSVMAVSPSLPVKTVPEFIAYAKANSGKISMASPGNGTMSHMSGELFKVMTGVNMVHVPYRGGAPALTDLIAGQVQVMFMSPVGSIEYIRAGKLRALGVTTAVRSETLRDVPTIGDFVPGYEASAWFGIGAPRGTSPETVDQLNKEINAGLANPKIKARLADLGASVLVGSPADFGKLIATETERWGKLIRTSNIRPE